MVYNYYFLITYGKDKILVLAEDGYQAVEIWVKSKRKKLEDEGRALIFSPDNYIVEKLNREDFVLKASN
ncbi:hypothetical protein P9E76_15405 [Schinkia azotoformans]|uniref:Uncharacterized protein n=1 Tax=Schinkia azotoformans LMG 9581 TaxID=1131731 RepID=K6DIF0_SCHAZ|nr:hypothetical protein [Schinkia azotoformans]EKN68059.1 hypothetical protein BAZO_06064 [Schinkia azotoformans LMG 9581]MEC1638135.1 hypothetical protein [Schinkia azotoformans]MEC1946431.1 hypothetical protein [Schinkia azotoformans]MED4354084.1 hypothetical protein [Schinkia azotoformans]